MIKSNGGIIGPDNVTTGGAFGTASGVFKLGEVTDLIKDSKWPTAGPQGFQVTNSVRLNAADNPSMAVTQGTPTNVDKYTFSVWVKRADIGAANSKIFSVTSGSTYGEEKLEFNQDDLIWRQTDTSGNNNWQRVTDRVFRDSSAWYHIVVAYDSSQGTAGNRCKMYINGVQETSFSGSSDPSSNQDSYTNTSGRSLKFFALHSNLNSQNAGAYFSEMVYVDGQQLDPTSFGEENSQTGIWVPKVVTGLTFGDNGFYCEFKNSGALGADTSGNSNNLSVTNITSLDQSTDTCTTNFATINSLDNYYAQATFSNGNLTVVTPVSQYAYIRSTIAAPSGKWYAEMKITTASATDNQHGIVSDAAINSTGGVGERANAYGYRGSGQVVSGGSVVSYTAASYTAGDIISIAMDLDNNLIFFYKNGAIQNSGTGLAITAPASTTDGVYYFATSDNANLGGGTYQFDWNFGSPPFAISSGNTDTNGFGNFEYAVPSGYLSLNTKNLTAVLA